MHKMNLRYEIELMVLRKIMLNVNTDINAKSNFKYKNIEFDI